jgi:hypothetical protein
MRSERGNGVDGCCPAGTAEWFRRLFGLHFDAFFSASKELLEELFEGFG